MYVPETGVDNHLDLVNTGSLMLDQGMLAHANSGIMKSEMVGLWRARWRDVKRDHPGTSVCCQVCRRVTGYDSGLKSGHIPIIIPLIMT